MQHCGGADHGRTCPTPSSIATLGLDTIVAQP